jgi:copper chaperone
VTEVLSGVAGVDKVVGVDLESGEASIEGQADAAQLIAVVVEEGYQAQVI